MERLFTPTEAAEYLRVTKAAVYKWMTEGKLKFVYVGADRRITESAITAFVKESTERRQGEVDGGDTIEGNILIPGLAAQPELALT